MRGSVFSEPRPVAVGRPRATPCVSQRAFPGPCIHGVVKDTERGREGPLPPSGSPASPWESGGPPLQTFRKLSILRVVHTRLRKTASLELFKKINKTDK